MAKDKDDKKPEKKASKTPEQIEAEKAAKVAKKAEMAAKAKEEVEGKATAAAEGAAPAEGAGKSKGGKGAKGGGGGRKKDEGGEAIPFPKDYVPRLKARYLTDIAPKIMADLKIKNKFAVPRFEK